MNALSNPGNDVSESVRYVEGLNVGERYFVVLSDCCVEAEFEAVYTGLSESTRGIITFDNGVQVDTYRGRGWSALPIGDKSGATPTPG